MLRARMYDKKGNLKLKEILTRRAMLLAIGGTAVWSLKALSGPIQIGICGSLKDLQNAREYRFDYFEPAVAEIGALSDDDFAALLKQVSSPHLSCTRCNSFIRTLKVVGPAVDMDALKTYMTRSLDRCRQLGTKVVVWGSASSRNIPEGFSRDQTWSQIKTFLRQAGDIAALHNIVIAIEPLRKAESNIINTGAEALRLVQEVNHPHVKMIIDYYHLRIENEDPQILVTAAAQIVHIHFANPEGRRWPKLTDHDAEYAQFFTLLRQIDYRNGISIEGRGTFAADANDSLAFFRRFTS